MSERCLRWQWHFPLSWTQHCLTLKSSTHPHTWPRSSVSLGPTHFDETFKHFLGLGLCIHRRFSYTLMFPNTSIKWLEVFSVLFWCHLLKWWYRTLHWALCSTCRHFACVQVYNTVFVLYTFIVNWQTCIKYIWWSLTWTDYMEKGETCIITACLCKYKSHWWHLFGYIRELMHAGVRVTMLITTGAKIATSNQNAFKMFVFWIAAFVTRNHSPLCLTAGRVGSAQRAFKILCSVPVWSSRFFCNYSYFYHWETLWYGILGIPKVTLSLLFSFCLLSFPSLFSIGFSISDMEFYIIYTVEKNKLWKQWCILPLFAGVDTRMLM